MLNDYQYFFIISSYAFFAINLLCLICFYVINYRQTKQRLERLYEQYPKLSEKESN